MYGFGEKIKQLRQSKYLSQSQLASQLGVSTSAISQYETEVRIPRDEVKIRIAEFFETEVAHIFFLNKFHR
nr:MAG TPA: helix-turn-helix domain protein [Caudoviricetes sp.]